MFHDVGSTALDTTESHAFLLSILLISGTESEIIAQRGMACFCASELSFPNFYKQVDGEY